MICKKCGKETNGNQSLCTMCAAGAPISYKSSPGFPSPTSSLTGTAPAAPSTTAAPSPSTSKTDIYFKNTEIVKPQKQKVFSDPEKTNIYAVIGFLLAFLVPFAGVAFSILGLLKAKYLGNKYISLAGLITGIVFSLALILILVFGDISIQIRF